MKRDFWIERWQRNEIGFHQTEINSHLQAYWGALALPEGCPVFVPLCGKSRDMLWLRAQGHEVLGVEISPIAVREFFAENELEPVICKQGPFERWQCDGLTLLCGDLFDLTRDDLAACCAVFDRASLIALPPGMREAYVRHISALLPVQTKMLLVTLEYPQQEMDGPPFSVHEDEVRRLYEPDFSLTGLCRIDILPETRFADRGVTQMIEKAYQLTRKE